jgi:hypothetical protein
MRAMRSTRTVIAFILTAASTLASAAGLSEKAFRSSLNVGPTVSVAYRGLDCKAVYFAGFADQMAQPNAHADVDRAADGTAVTATVRVRGHAACPAPYPPITSLPPFDLRDLAGKRITADSLHGKPTLLSFFFATCMPCIREVDPFNAFAAAHPEMNFLAVTFDETDVARAFVKRFDLKWRVMPDAREFIERVRIKSYPTVALFAADGTLLGTRQGGARDELEQANVVPQLTRWTDGLLRNGPDSGGTREVNQ